jgi:DNA-directed RNA polymerase subunit RPC12/RpoP
VPLENEDRLVPLKCGQCGGPLESTGDADVFQCAYCKCSTLVEGRAAQPVTPAAEEVRKTESYFETISPLIECSAGLRRSTRDGHIGHPGKLTLTENRLIFFARCFGIRNYWLIIPLSKVREVLKVGGFLGTGRMDIVTIDEVKFEFNLGWAYNRFTERVLAQMRNL